MTTTHEYRGYVFTITYQAKEPAYVVDFPDIADIITSGDTLTAAFAHACEGRLTFIWKVCKSSAVPGPNRHIGW